MLPKSHPVRRRRNPGLREAAGDFDTAADSGAESGTSHSLTGTGKFHRGRGSSIASCSAADSEYQHSQSARAQATSGLAQADRQRTDYGQAPQPWKPGPRTTQSRTTQSWKPQPQECPAARQNRTLDFESSTSDEQPACRLFGGAATIPHGAAEKKVRPGCSRPG